MAADQKIWQGVRYAAIAGGMYVAGLYGARIGLTAEQVPDLVDKGIGLAQRAVELGGALVSFAAIIQGFIATWKNTMVPTAVVQAAAASPTIPTIPVASGLTGAPKLPE